MTDEDAITLRRRMDDQFADAIRDYQKQQQEMAERLARIDEALSHLKVEFDAGRQSRTNIQEIQTTISERLTALASRFIEHINDESSERALLQEMTRTVAAHSERLTTLERMQIALGSVVATLATSGVVWIIGHLTVSAAR